MRWVILNLSPSFTANFKLIRKVRGWDKGNKMFSAKSPSLFRNIEITTVVGGG